MCLWDTFLAQTSEDSDSESDEDVSLTLMVYT